MGKFKPEIMSLKTCPSVNPTRKSEKAFSKDNVIHVSGAHVIRKPYHIFVYDPVFSRTELGSRTCTSNE